MTLLEAKELQLTWGKHAGKKLGEVAELDVTYLDFLAGKTWLDFHFAGGVAVLCEAYGRKPKQTIVRDRDAGQGRLF